jgi:hypothetical protein
LFLIRLQFNFGVPFKHLKLTETNRFGEFITDKDMTAATQACKDAYKAWCQAKGIPYKDPEKFAAEKSLAYAISSAQRGNRHQKGAGNGFKSRGFKGRAGHNRNNNQSTSRGGKKSSFSGRGSWQKNRGGKSGSRGKPTNKRVVGGNEQKD